VESELSKPLDTNNAVLRAKIHDNERAITDRSAVNPHVESDTAVYWGLDLVLKSFHQDFERKTLDRNLQGFGQGSGNG